MSRIIYTNNTHVMMRFTSLFFFAATAAVLCFVIAIAANPAHAAQPPSAWRGRRIYQLMVDRFNNPAASPSNSNPANCVCDNNQGCGQYCGGTWQGVQAQLPYIADLGFNAIWISPIPAQVGDTQFSQSYHGYWAGAFCPLPGSSDNDACVNSKFGAASDLKSMIDAAHAMGIWVMADIVVNHAGPIGDSFNLIQPFNSSNSYHADCAVTQYACFTQEIHECRLASLPDLDQGNPDVLQQLQKYVQWTVHTFGFDGIRLDTSMYVKRSELAAIFQPVGTIVMGEVWSQDWSCENAYATSGAVTSTENYGLFNAVRSVWLNGGSMTQLGANWRRVRSMPYPYLEGNFVNNQDNTYFLGENNGAATSSAYLSALSHAFFQEGMPIVWQGSEQLGYNGHSSVNMNRKPLWFSNFDTTNHLYRFVKSMNAAYVKFGLGHQQVQERWMDATMYCFSRGVILHCSTNSDQSQTRTIPNLPSSWAGRQICDFYNPTQQCVAGSSTMQITVSATPILLYPKA